MNLNLKQCWESTGREAFKVVAPQSGRNVNYAITSLKELSIYGQATASLPKCRDCERTTPLIYMNNNNNENNNSNKPACQSIVGVHGDMWGQSKPTAHY